MSNINKLFKIKLSIKLNIPFLCSLLLSDVVLFNKCIDGTLLDDLKILLLGGIDEFVLRNLNNNNLGPIDSRKMQEFITNNCIINELFLYINQPSGKTMVLFDKLWVNLYNENPSNYSHALFQYLIDLFNMYVNVTFGDYSDKYHSLNSIIKMVSKLRYADYRKLGHFNCLQSFKLLNEKKLQVNGPEKWWPKNIKQLYFSAFDESEFIPNMVQLLNIIYLKAWCREIYKTYSYPINIINDYIVVEAEHKDKFLKVLRNYFITDKRTVRLCFWSILYHLRPYPTNILILIKNFEASLAEASVMEAHILELDSEEFDNSLITIIHKYPTI
jgi:hypothetical protein